MQEARNGKDLEADEEEELDELGGINERLIRQHKLPLSAQSAFSYIPPRRKDPPELSYFHQESKEGILSLYDCIFKRPIGYDKRLHRCDREHAKSRGLRISDEVTSALTFLRGGTRLIRDCRWRSGLNRCAAGLVDRKVTGLNREKARPTAVLSSSEYGRHIDQPVEELIRDHARINRVQAEFYRKNGIACLVEKSSGSIDPV
ncbi:hypothetical protein EYD10_12960 [Varanus komodoensis]|nr:hypothetical protein EYD10_12960 [Varanus komodoensis]